MLAKSYTLLFILISVTLIFVYYLQEWISIWPPVAALITILITKKTIIGLLLGSLIGTIFLSSGFLSFFEILFKEQLYPLIVNRWNISLILFAFLLGAFTEILERGGGFKILIEHLMSKKKNRSKRSIEMSAFGLGIICFFDGLANSMIVGKTFAGPAEKHGIPREKIAYIVDSTSSSVACVSILSTWIVYQLAMIREGLLVANTDLEKSIFSLYIDSIPYNFYCLFTLIILFLAITYQWNIGPMRRVKTNLINNLETHIQSTPSYASFRSVLIPLFFLILSIFIGMYISGSNKLKLPSSIEQVSISIGSSNTLSVMIISSILSLIIACYLNFRSIHEQQDRLLNVIGVGFKKLISPVAILFSAWLLSSILRSLNIHEVIEDNFLEKVKINLFPTYLFLIGSILSFFTGTSWGTIGLLMPLTLPIILGFNENISSTYIAPSIAAVFSGAVFGDHCSPFSDTTIISSLACDIEPFNHVKTQLPYALLASIISIFIGFIPIGFGFSPLLLIILGSTLVVFIIHLHKKFRI